MFRSLLRIVPALAFLMVSGVPALAADPTFCSEPYAQIDRPSVGDDPCTLDAATFALETGYYQNASRDGQTQLAAYPEARVRFGALTNTEFFIDAPNEIAVAGPAIHRDDAYTDQPGGIGAAFNFFDGPHGAYGATVEYGPPNPAYSDIDARARYSAAFDGGIDIGQLVRLTGTVKLVDGHRYGEKQPGDFNLFESLSAGYRFGSLTHAGLESAVTDGSGRDHARAQTLGGAFVERDLSRRMFLDANIGTTFNPDKHTKPHYLGSGVSYRM